MSNMGYCRFQNTLSDLRDCWEHMNDSLESDEEVAARRRLIKICVRIADNHREEVES
jgi:hypothetical protein